MVDENVISEDTSIDPSHFVAGTIAGMTGVVAGHPLDTIKVRIQTVKGFPPSITKSISKTIKNEGVLALYKGLLSPLLTVGLINSIVFGVYGNTLQVMESGDSPSLTQHFYAGMAGGFSNSFICGPAEYIKTQLQIQTSSSARKYNGMYDCTKHIYKRAGFRGFFKGYVATCWREIPSYGFYFGVYVYLRDQIMPQSNFGVMMSGGLAGAAAWISSYPFDVIKSRIQAQPLRPDVGHDRYRGFIDATKKIYKSGGHRVFWHGLSTCIVRSVPVNAITFYFYEFILEMMASE